MSFTEEFNAAMKGGGTKKKDGPDDFARSFRSAFQSGDASLRDYTAPNAGAGASPWPVRSRVGGSPVGAGVPDGPKAEASGTDTASAQPTAGAPAARYTDPLTELAREEARRAAGGVSAASRSTADPLTHHSGKFPAMSAAEIGEDTGRNTAREYPTKGAYVKDTVAPGTPGGGGRGTLRTPTFGEFVGGLFDPKKIGEAMREPTSDQILASDDYLSPYEAASFGFAQPTLSVGEALSRSLDRDFGDEESHRQMDAFGNDLADTLAKAKTEHPLAYWLGSAAGDLALTAGLGSVVGAIPGVSALPSAARGAVTGAAALGGREFVQGIGDAAAGRTNARDFTRDVLASGLTGALTGAGTAVIGDALSAAAKPRLRMEDFINPDSPVWTNVPYEDVQTQNRIMLDTHREMVEAGQTVTVSDQIMDTVAEFYPNLRSWPKSERMPVLRRAMMELKNNLREFLNGLKGSYDFEVNGNILEARLYSTGVKEVMQSVTQPKAAMLYASEDIFRNARYLYSTPDYAGDPNIFRWNYFYTPVQIGDETLGVRIAVRDMAKGTFLEPESQIYHWGLK